MSRIVEPGTITVIRWLTNLIGWKCSSTARVGANWTPTRPTTCSRISILGCPMEVHVYNLSLILCTPSGISFLLLLFLFFLLYFCCWSLSAACVCTQIEGSSTILCRSSRSLWSLSMIARAMQRVRISHLPNDCFYILFIFISSYSIISFLAAAEKKVVDQLTRPDP